MQARCITIGLQQRTIARLFGHTEATVSRAIRRPDPPRWIEAITTAWELMTPAQRALWGRLAGVEFGPRQRLD